MMQLTFCPVRRRAGRGFDRPETLMQNARRREAQAAGAWLLEDERRFIDLPKSPLWWGRYGSRLDQQG